MSVKSSSTSSMPVRALVLTGYGLNCDGETAHALRLAGAEAQRCHISEVVAKQVSLKDFQILVLGGGFSWGDDHGAGVLQAIRLKTHLQSDLLAFIRDGKLIIGICNGFQTLVNMGLLPGFGLANSDPLATKSVDMQDTDVGDAMQREVALIHNDCGNFRDQWVNLTINPQSPCVFTRDLTHLELPVRHGEGKFYTGPQIISTLQDNQQVVMTYSRPDQTPAAGEFPHNPNGSVADIAGICDPSGRIFGLMPHPEAYHHFTNHPDWTRYRNQNNAQDEQNITSSLPPLGTRLFTNAVTYWRS